MIVFDVSTLVGAALRHDSTPERALLKARTEDVLALSAAVEAELDDVLRRPKFAAALSPARRDRVLDLVRAGAVRFEPIQPVTDCRDSKDNKYLELALAAGATIIVSSDEDLPVLDPWRGVRVVRPAAYLSGALAPAPSRRAD